MEPGSTVSLVETRARKAYATVYDFSDTRGGKPRPDDPTVCIVGMDGTVWADWDRLNDMVEYLSSDPTNSWNMSMAMQLRHIILAKPRLTVVTREIAEKNAEDYAANNPNMSMVPPEATGIYGAYMTADVQPPAGDPVGPAVEGAACG